MHHFALTDEALEQRHRRVFRLEVEGARFYVKKLRPGGPTLAHALQRALFRLTNEPLLRPTIIADPAQAQTYEADRLIRLKELGLPVPAVVYRDPRYIVLEDVGKPLHKLILKYPERAQTLAEDAIHVLANLHRTGLAHGATQLRNFTLHNDTVHLIDFEEDMEQGDPAALQFRDIVIFLVYLEGLNAELDSRGILTRYEIVSERPVIGDLKQLLQRYAFLRVLDRRLFHRLRMGDLQTAVRFIARADEF